MKRLAVVLLVVLVALLQIAPAFAAEQTVTITLKVSAPLIGKSALGTMVLHNAGDPSSLATTWTFTGQVDGQPASASGQAEGRFTGNTYDLTITRVDTWDMNGIPHPKLPLRMTARPGAHQTVDLVVFAHTLGTVSTPLSVQGVTGVPAPFTGDLTLSVTNAPGGVVRVLPRTGVGDPLPAVADLGVIGGVALLLLVGTRALVVARRLRQVAR